MFVCSYGIYYNVAAITKFSMLKTTEGKNYMTVTTNIKKGNGVDVFNLYEDGYHTGYEGEEIYNNTPEDYQKVVKLIDDIPEGEEKAEE